jgi:hypothetical protein
VYNGRRGVLGTDDSCPQGSLSLLERKVEVAVNIFLITNLLKEKAQSSILTLIQHSWCFWLLKRRTHRLITSRPAVEWWGSDVSLLKKNGGLSGRTATSSYQSRKQPVIEEINSLKTDAMIGERALSSSFRQMHVSPVCISHYEYKDHRLISSLLSTHLVTRRSSPNELSLSLSLSDSLSHSLIFSFSLSPSFSLSL